MAWIFAAFTMAYAAFEIPTGYWGDKMGARRVLIRVVLWWSFFTAATGWVWNFRSLFIVRFLFGAGEAGCFPNIARAFNRWLPRDERVRAQGILWMSARWGGAVAPLLLVLVLQYVNWRRAFERVRRARRHLVRVLVPLVPRQAGRPSQGQRRRARADADLRGQVRPPARAVGGDVLVAVAVAALAAVLHAQLRVVLLRHLVPDLPERGPQVRPQGAGRAAWPACRSSSAASARCSPATSRRPSRA